MDSHANYLSIIICTFNRLESLKRMLDGALNQKRDPLFDYEVILVDNNSTDGTKEYVQEAAGRSEGRLKYIFEGRQGVSYARNRGIQEAKGSILVFTDDDVLLEEDWLFQIWLCFKNNDCDMVGGRILPLYAKNTPGWIKECADLLTGPIIMHDNGEGIKEYDCGQMKPPVGANMAFKKDLFKEHGLFRVDIGVGQGTLGDDTELAMRLIKNNRKIMYCGKALVYHPAERARTNLRYIAKYKIGFGKYLVAVDDEALESEGLVYFGGVPRYAIREVCQTAVALIFNIFNKRRFVRLWCHLFVHLGIIFGYRKQRKADDRS